jgi:predicted small lipoprotein YifL
MTGAMVLTLLIALAGCGNIVGPVYGPSAGANSGSDSSAVAPRTNPKMDGPPGALAPEKE